MDMPIVLLTSETQAKEDTSLQDALTNHLLNSEQQDLVAVEREEEVFYEVVKGGTNRGKDLLIDSLGFKYTLKRNNSTNSRIWRCAVRNQTLRCPAVVTQRNGRFSRGAWKHEHLVGQTTPIRNSKFSRTPTKRSKNFIIIKGGSKHGMDILKDSNGYTYTFRKKTCEGRKTSWGCSVRNKRLVCKTTVTQIGTRFFPSALQHNHLPGSGKPLEEGEQAIPLPDGDCDDSDLDVSSAVASIDPEPKEDMGNSAENGADHSYTCAVVPALGVKKANTRQLKHETNQRPVSQMNNNSSNEIPEIVDLNVGGQTFTVAKTTLIKYPESRLAAMFSGQEIVPRDKIGNYFIDGDGDMFKHILSFLRFSTFPQCSDPVSLYEHAMYFNLKSLISLLERHKNVQEKLYHDEIKACFADEYSFYDSIQESVFSHLERVHEQDEIVFELVTTCRHHIEKLPVEMSNLLEKYHWSLLRYTSARCSCVQMAVCGKKAGLGRCIGFDLKHLGYKTLICGISSMIDTADDDDDIEDDGDAEERKALRKALYCSECAGSVACVDYVWVGSGDTPAPDWGSHWFKDLANEQS